MLEDIYGAGLSLAANLHRWSTLTSEEKGILYGIHLVMIAHFDTVEDSVVDDLRKHAVMPGDIN